MGIFEDEAKEMYKEAQDEIRKKAEREAAQHDLANVVSDDLQRYITVAQLSGIEHYVEANHVKVRRVANNSTLDIACEEDDAFRVIAEQDTFHDVLTKKEMARRVLEWLGR